MSDARPGSPLTQTKNTQLIQTITMAGLPDGTTSVAVVAARAERFSRIAALARNDLQYAPDGFPAPVLEAPWIHRRLQRNNQEQRRQQDQVFALAVGMGEQFEGMQRQLEEQSRQLKALAVGHCAQTSLQQQLLELLDKIQDASMQVCSPRVEQEKPSLPYGSHTPEEYHTIAWLNSHKQAGRIKHPLPHGFKHIRKSATHTENRSSASDQTRTTVGALGRIASQRSTVSPRTGTDRSDESASKRNTAVSNHSRDKILKNPNKRLPLVAALYAKCKHKTEKKASTREKVQKSIQDHPNLVEHNRIALSRLEVQENQSHSQGVEAVEKKAMDSELDDTILDSMLSLHKYEDELKLRWLVDDGSGGHSIMDEIANLGDRKTSRLIKEQARTNNTNEWLTDALMDEVLKDIAGMQDETRLQTMQGKRKGGQMRVVPGVILHSDKKFRIQEVNACPDLASSHETLAAAVRGREYCDILRECQAHYPTVVSMENSVASMQPPTQQHNPPRLFSYTDKELIEFLVDEHQEMNFHDFTGEQRKYLAELLRIEQPKQVAGMGRANIHQIKLRCPRCFSWNTKFDYFNNNSNTQPRFKCKAGEVCNRQWTVGGKLKDIPAGGYKSRSQNKKNLAGASTGTKGIKKSSEKKLHANKGIVINEAQVQHVSTTNQLQVSSTNIESQSMGNNAYIGDLFGASSLNCMVSDSEQSSGGYFNGDSSSEDNVKDSRIFFNENIMGDATNGELRIFISDKFENISEVPRTFINEKANQEFLEENNHLFSINVEPNSDFSEIPDDYLAQFIHAD